MSLLPIIYTSLILFFGLMLIVTIISYIAYKLKAERNPLIEEEHKKYYQSKIPQRIISLQNNSIQSYADIYKSKIKYDINPKIVQNVNHIKNNSEINKNSSKYFSHGTKNLKPRIQIMNKPSVPTNKILQKQNNIKVSADISKFDLLKYYIDLNDNKLEFMKVIPSAR